MYFCSNVAYKLVIISMKNKVQLNLSITATQWRSKKWPLWTGDLYIEGPSSAGDLIYFLSHKMFPFGRHFQKDRYHNISKLVGIVDFKLLIIT